MPTCIDRLTEDPVIPGQAWCCISCLSPETVKNCNYRGIKVRGVYATYEEAKSRAEYLQSIDPNFNIFVGEVGKWLGWDPDPNTLDDQVFREKKLQEIMENYNKNTAKAKLLEEQRKLDILEDSVKNHPKNTDTRNRLRKKLEKRHLDAKLKELEHNRFKNTNESPELAKTNKVLKEESKRLDANEKIISNVAENLSSVDEQINFLQQEYKRLQAEKLAKKQTDPVLE